MKFKKRREISSKTEIILASKLMVDRMSQWTFGRSRNFAGSGSGKCSLGWWIHAFIIGVKK